MNELIALFKTVSPWLGALIVIAYVLIWHVIPHWKARDQRKQEFEQAERAKEREFKHQQAERIQAREDGILKDISSFIQQNIAASNAVSQRMDALTEEIRAENRERHRR